MFGGAAALALLIGVAFFAAATGGEDNSLLEDTPLGEMLQKGVDNGKGEMTRAMDGDCDPEEAEQVREQEQLKDGSCGDGPAEDGSGEMDQEQSQQRSEGSEAPEDAEQTREREQVKDGSCEEEGSDKMTRTMDEDCDPEDAEQVREQEQLKDGSCGDGPAEDGSGEMKQEQSQQRSKGSEAPEDAEQTREREQLKDGSCDDDASEDEEVDTSSAVDAEDGSTERSGDQQHDRDREQDNGGTGPQNHYGNE